MRGRGTWPRTWSAEGLGALTCRRRLLDGADGAPANSGRPRNAPRTAPGCCTGASWPRYDKHHLPNYGVFDEYRYFVPGEEPLIIDIGGVDVAVAICEDLWQDGGPVHVGSGSRGRTCCWSSTDRHMSGPRTTFAWTCAGGARPRPGCPLAYVNMVGGQDELVFDGDSMVVAPDGTLLARAPQFVPLPARDRPRLRRSRRGRRAAVARDCRSPSTR